MTAPRMAARLAPVAALVLVLAGVSSRALPEDRPRLSGASPSAALEGDFADPFVVHAQDRYFAFATGVPGQNFQVAVSKDLATWSRLPDALPELPAWAAKRPGLTWAPAVLARRGGYVLYYTARHLASGFQCISVARSSRPEGPYVDSSTRPLVCQVDPAAAGGALCGSIDPSPFVDADGTPYLLWKSDENARECRTAPRLWSQRLSDDGLALVGAASALMARDRSWEGDIVEGPSMVRHDGRYYLFYSANWYASSAYAVGYATCTSPLGGCTKITTGGPLLASAGSVLGPGGQELFTDASGTLWMAYHAWSAPHTTYEAGGARSLRLARVRFAPDGTPVAVASR